MDGPGPSVPSLPQPSQIQDREVELDLGLGLEGKIGPGM